MNGAALHEAFDKLEKESEELIELLKQQLDGERRRLASIRAMRITAVSTANANKEGVTQ